MEKKKLPIESDTTKPLQKGKKSKGVSAEGNRGTGGSRQGNAGHSGSQNDEPSSRR